VGGRPCYHVHRPCSAQWTTCGSYSIIKTLPSIVSLFQTRFVIQGKTCLTHQCYGPACHSIPQYALLLMLVFKLTTIVARRGHIRFERVECLSTLVTCAQPSVSHKQFLPAKKLRSISFLFKYPDGITAVLEFVLEKLSNNSVTAIVMFNSPVIVFAEKDIRCAEFLDR